MDRGWTALSMLYVRRKILKHYVLLRFSDAVRKLVVKPPPRQCSDSAFTPQQFCMTNARARHAIRRYFIACEEYLQQIAPEEHQKLVEGWKKKRIAACDEHKSMGDAMKGYIGRTDDRQHGFAYSNECTFLNRLVLGMHPPAWAKKNGIQAKKVRDHMNADQLALLVYLESRNCTLLDLDTPTPERKAKLTGLAQRWLAEHLDGYF